MAVDNVTTEADVVEMEKKQECDLGDLVDSVSGARFLRALADCQLTDPVVSSFLTYTNNCAAAHNLLSPINFPLDHPVEEVARYDHSSSGGSSNS